MSLVLLNVAARRWHMQRLGTDHHCFCGDTSIVRMGATEFKEDVQASGLCVLRNLEDVPVLQCLLGKREKSLVL
nr:hypothetical protein SrhCFBP13529_12360 [Stenotrophomonas rhizophila]